MRVSMGRFAFVISLALIGLSSLSGELQSSEKKTALWGGLGFSSFSNDTLSPAAEELRVCAVDKQLGTCGGFDIFAASRKIFAEHSFEHLNLEVGLLAADQTIGYFVSPVITTEFVIKAKAEGQFFYTFLVVGNLLVYEATPTETNYVYSVPYSVQASEYFANELTAREELNYIQEWYRTDRQDDNFFYQMASNAIKSLEIPLSFGNYVQFTDISFSDSVASILSETASPDSWKKTISAFAEARLAAQTGKPIIPSSLGENQLELFFADGSRKINLPQPMYEFELFVKIFKLQAPSADWACFNVGTYYSVKAFEDTLLNVPIVHGEDSCGYYSAKDADPTMAFPANLFEQIHEVMKAFSSAPGGDNYARTHISKNASENLSAIRSIRESVFEN